MNSNNIDTGSHKGTARGQPGAPLVDCSNIMAKSLGLNPASTIDQQQRQRMVQSNQKKHRLKQRFTVVRKLGKGTYGKVQLAINKETGQEVAIKTIKKTKIESEQDLIRIRREIQIMSSIEHPHIVHIYEVFENKDKIVLVMQYASGGELYEYVSQCKLLDDNEARRLFRQISTAIYYCHQNKICHRDLKLENILLDERNNAKIADFGLSNVFASRHYLKTFCGSPLYASPEIVNGQPYIGPEVDCWSLGVLLYTLVYGAMPFDGSNFKRLVKQISEASYFEPKQKSLASPLIRKLLTCDPRKRATIIDICLDPWVNGHQQQQQDLQHHHSLLKVAEDMANLTPVRFDILMALAPVSPPTLDGETNVLALPVDSNSDNLTKQQQQQMRVMMEKDTNDADMMEKQQIEQQQQAHGQKRMNNSELSMPSLVMASAIMNEQENEVTQPVASFVVRKNINSPEHNQLAHQDQNRPGGDSGRRDIKRSRISDSCSNQEQMMMLDSEMNDTDMADGQCDEQIGGQAGDQAQTSHRKQYNDDNDDDDDDGQSDITTTNERQQQQQQQQQQQRVEVTHVTVEPTCSLDECELAAKCGHQSPIIFSETKLVSSETVINLPCCSPEPLLSAARVINTNADALITTNNSLNDDDKTHLDQDKMRPDPKSEIEASGSADAPVDSDKSQRDEMIDARATDEVLKLVEGDMKIDDMSSMTKSIDDESKRKIDDAGATDCMRENRGEPQSTAIMNEVGQPSLEQTGAIDAADAIDAIDASEAIDAATTGKKKKVKKKIIVKKKKKLDTAKPDSDNDGTALNGASQSVDRPTKLDKGEKEGLVDKKDGNLPVSATQAPSTKPPAHSKSLLLLGKLGGPPGKLKIPESFQPANNMISASKDSSIVGVNNIHSSGIHSATSSHNGATPDHQESPSRRASILSQAGQQFKSIVNVADVTKKMSQFPKSLVDTQKPAPIPIGPTLVKVSDKKAIFERKFSQSIQSSDLLPNGPSPVAVIDSSSSGSSATSVAPSCDTAKEPSLASAVASTNNIVSTIIDHDHGDDDDLKQQQLSKEEDIEQTNVSKQMAEIISNFQKLSEAAENDNDDSNTNQIGDTIEVDSSDQQSSSRIKLKLVTSSASSIVNDLDNDDEDEVVVTLPSPAISYHHQTTKTSSLLMMDKKNNDDTDEAIEDDDDDDARSTIGDNLSVVQRDKRSDSIETLKQVDISDDTNSKCVGSPTKLSLNSEACDNLIKVDVDFDVASNVQVSPRPAEPEKIIQSTFQINLSQPVCPKKSTSVDRATGAAIPLSDTVDISLPSSNLCVSSNSQHHQHESNATKNAVVGGGLAPIARSYKKVTFTKDGACITETGKIYSSEENDGTFTRVEHKSKITHYPEMMSSTNDDARMTMNKNGGGGDDQQQMRKDELPPIKTRPFPRRMMMPDEAAGFPFVPMATSFNDNNGGGGGGNNQNMQSHVDRPFNKMMMKNFNDNLIRSGSESSCSSGSTDAFDDIFDKWTGGDQFFFNRSFMKMKNMFRLPAPMSLFAQQQQQQQHKSPFDAMPNLMADDGGDFRSKAAFKNLQLFTPDSYRNNSEEPDRYARNNGGFMSSDLNSVFASKRFSDHHNKFFDSSIATVSRPHQQQQHQQKNNSNTNNSSFFDDDSILNDALDRHFTDSTSFQTLANRRRANRGDLSQTNFMTNSGPSWKGSTPSLFSTSSLSNQRHQLAFDDIANPIRPAQQPSATQGIWRFIRPGLEQDPSSMDSAGVTSQQECLQQQADHYANKNVSPEPRQVSPFSRMSRMYSDMGNHCITRRRQQPVARQQTGEDDLSSQPQPHQQQVQVRSELTLNMRQLPSHMNQHLHNRSCQARDGTQSAGLNYHLNNSNDKQATLRASGFNFKHSQPTAQAYDDQSYHQQQQRQDQQEQLRQSSIPLNRVPTRRNTVGQKPPTGRGSSGSVGSQYNVPLQQSSSRLSLTNRMSSISLGVKRTSSTGTDNSTAQTMVNQSEHQHTIMSGLQQEQKQHLKTGSVVHSSLEQQQQQRESRSGFYQDIPQNVENPFSRIEHWLHNSMNDVSGSESNNNGDSLYSCSSTSRDDDLPGQLYYNNNNNALDQPNRRMGHLSAALFDSDYSRTNPLHMYATLGRNPNRKLTQLRQQQQTSSHEAITQRSKQAGENLQEASTMEQQQQQYEHRMSSIKNLYSTNLHSADSVIDPLTSSMTSREPQSQIIRATSSNSQTMNLSSSSSLSTTMNTQSSLPPSGIFSVNQLQQQQQQQQRSNSTLATSSSFKSQKSVAQHQLHQHQQQQHVTSELEKTEAISSEQLQQRHHQVEQHKTRVIKTELEAATDGLSVSSGTTITLKQQSSNSSSFQSIVDRERLSKSPASFASLSQSIDQQQQQQQQQQQSSSFSSRSVWSDQQQEKFQTENYPSPHGPNNSQLPRRLVAMSAPIDASAGCLNSGGFKWSQITSPLIHNDNNSSTMESCDDLNEEEPLSLLEQLRARGYRSIVNQRLSARKQVESSSTLLTTTSSSTSSTGDNQQITQLMSSTHQSSMEQQQQQMQKTSVSQQQQQQQQQQISITEQQQSTVVENSSSGLLEDLNASDMNSRLAASSPASLDNSRLDNCSDSCNDSSNKNVFDRPTNQQNRGNVNGKIASSADALSSLSSSLIDEQPLRDENNCIISNTTTNASSIINDNIYNDVKYLHCLSPASINSNNNNNQLDRDCFFKLMPNASFATNQTSSLQLNHCKRIINNLKVDDRNCCSEGDCKMLLIGDNIGDNVIDSTVMSCHATTTTTEQQANSAMVSNDNCCELIYKKQFLISSPSTQINPCAPLKVLINRFDGGVEDTIAIASLGKSSEPLQNSLMVDSNKTNPAALNYDKKGKCNIEVRPQNQQYSASAYVNSDRGSNKPMNGLLCIPISISRVNESKSTEYNKCSCCDLAKKTKNLCDRKLNRSKCHVIGQQLSTNYNNEIISSVQFANADRFRQDQETKQSTSFNGTNECLEMQRENNESKFISLSPLSSSLSSSSSSSSLSGSISTLRPSLSPSRLLAVTTPTTTPIPSAAARKSFDKADNSDDDDNSHKKPKTNCRMLPNATVEYAAADANVVACASYNFEKKSNNFNETLSIQNNDDINDDQLSNVLPAVLYPLVYSRSPHKSSNNNNKYFVKLLNNNNNNNNNNNDPELMNLNSLDGCEKLLDKNQSTTSVSHVQHVSLPLTNESDVQHIEKQKSQQNNDLSSENDIDGQHNLKNGLVNSTVNELQLSANEDDRPFSPSLSRAYLERQLEQMRKTQQFLESLKQQEQIELRQRQENYLETLNSLDRLKPKTNRRGLELDKMDLSSSLMNSYDTNRRSTSASVSVVGDNETTLESTSKDLNSNSAPSEDFGCKIASDDYCNTADNILLSRANISNLKNNGLDHRLHHHFTDGVGGQWRWPQTTTIGSSSSSKQSPLKKYNFPLLSLGDEQNHHHHHLNDDASCNNQDDTHLSLGPRSTNYNSSDHNLSSEYDFLAASTTTSRPIISRFNLSSDHRLKFTNHHHGSTNMSGSATTHSFGRVRKEPMWKSGCDFTFANEKSNTQLDNDDDNDDDDDDEIDPELQSYRPSAHKPAIKTLDDDSSTILISTGRRARSRSTLIGSHSRDQSTNNQGSSSTADISADGSSSVSGDINKRTSRIAARRFSYTTSDNNEFRSIKKIDSDDEDRSANISGVSEERRKRSISISNNAIDENDSASSSTKQNQATLSSYRSGRPSLRSWLSLTAAKSDNTNYIPANRYNYNRERANNADNSDDNIRKQSARSRSRVQLDRNKENNGSDEDLTSLSMSITATNNASKYNATVICGGEKKSKLSELEERITARKKRTLSLLTSIECNPTAIKSNVEQQASQRKKYGSTNDHYKDIKASGSTTRKRTQTFGGQYDNDKDENNGKRESMEERIKRKSYYCRVGSGGHKQQHHQKSITNNRSNGIKADNDTTIGKESKDDETTKTDGKPTVSSG